ncbi:hypothetical protein YC2023_017002 [Brassica napus]
MVIHTHISSYLNQKKSDDILVDYKQQSSGPGGKRFEDKIVDTLKKYVNEGAYLSEKWLKKHCLFNHFPHLHTCTYISNLIASPKVLLIEDGTMPIL